MNAEDKLKNLFKDIFQVDESDFRDDLKPGTVKEWDSVSHLVLFTALEEEFDIQIRSEELIELTTVGKIRDLLSSRGIE
jgi:acyl carrier protein